MWLHFLSSTLVFSPISENILVFMMFYSKINGGEKVLGEGKGQQFLSTVSSLCYGSVHSDEPPHMGQRIEWELCGFPKMHFRLAFLKKNFLTNEFLHLVSDSSIWLKHRGTCWGHVTQVWVSLYSVFLIPPCWCEENHFFLACCPSWRSEVKVRYMNELVFCSRPPQHCGCLFSHWFITGTSLLLPLSFILEIVMVSTAASLK